ncbi:hypothetical protein BC830DRAFT_1214176 [Chytriomyces sp. MP71]|nr:hypothetical protein BC830DRAFT_1214176 [Chytriomyces sp. MP71]
MNHKKWITIQERFARKGSVVGIHTVPPTDEKNPYWKIIDNYMTTYNISYYANNYFPIHYGPEYNAKLYNCTHFCGYHSSYTWDHGVTNTFDGIIADCSRTCDYGVNGFEPLTCLVSHVLFETVTNPLVSAGKLSGWTDDVNNEVGDKCAAQCYVNEAGYATQFLWSNADNMQCQLNYGWCEHCNNQSKEWKPSQKQRKPDNNHRGGTAPVDPIPLSAVDERISPTP